MPITKVVFSEFVEFFLNGDKEAAKKYEEFKEEGDDGNGEDCDVIRLLHQRDTDAKNKSPLLWTDILWTPVGIVDEWNKMRINYSVSSSFAVWWSSQEIEDEDGDEDESVDDYDAPNDYPYKKCIDCRERSSCGSYNEHKEWVCEDCA